MKKFILRIMACLMMATMIGTCFGNVGTAFADEAAHTGSVTVKEPASWWYYVAVTQEELLGDVKAEDVEYIEFTGSNNFIIQYHNTTGDSQDNKDSEYYDPYTYQSLNVTSYTAKHIDFTTEKYMFNICFSQADDIDCTVTWNVYAKAAAPVEEPKAEEPKAEEPKTEAPVSNDLVINFVDLSHGGYGYEARVNGDAVDVSIASQYQEIQYVLPEVVDLAAYTTLVVDVTSNAQLDIKLVDPNAELNEYSQKAPFLDNYTEGGAITSPITIDLAAYADKDLSQINFMAMGNDTTFTIKSITFTSQAKAEEPKVEEPVETPVEEPKEEEPKTEEPKTEEPKEEAPATSDNTTTGREVKEGESVYTVKKGDCLWSIAKQFLGKGARYVELFERNSDILTDATLIKKGQEIIIPAK